MKAIGWRILGATLDCITTALLWIAAGPLWIAMRSDRFAKASHRKVFG